MPENPHALYFNYDGTMNYGAGNPGGVGYVIRSSTEYWWFCQWNLPGFSN